MHISSRTAKRRNIFQPWSKADIRKLKMLFPYTHNYQLGEIFNRTIQAIGAKARRLKLKKKYDDDFKPKRKFGAKRWSDEEIKILKEMYPLHTTEEISDMIDRTAAGICGMAHRLKLRKLSPWTKKHDAFLRRFHTKKSYDKIASALNRTADSVLWRAKKLGITTKVPHAVRPSVPWIKKEYDLFIKHYPTTTAKELGKRIGRSKGAIDARARVLGIKKYTEERNWTKQQDKIIRKYYKKMRYKDLAVKLGRSCEAVQSRISKLGLMKNGWTDKNIRLLKREFLKGTSMLRTAKLLGKGKSTCNGKIKELGLRRS